MRKVFPLRGRWQPEGLTDEVLRQWCGAADSPSVSIIGLRTESLVGAPLPGCSKGGNAGGRGRPPLRTYTKRISRRGDPCGCPPEPPPISKPFWTAREGGPYGHIQTALLVRRFTNRLTRRAGASPPPYIQNNLHRFVILRRSRRISGPTVARCVGDSSLRSE